MPNLRLPLQPQKSSGFGGITQIDCNNATITLNAAGSTAQGALIFLWSDGSTNPSLSVDMVGTYEVTITDDANGCTETATFAIEEATDLEIDLAGTTITDVACFGETTGAIDLKVNGGTPPYTYLWSNGDTTLRTSAFKSGKYFLTAKDSNACTNPLSRKIISVFCACSFNYCDNHPIHLDGLWTRS